MNDFNVAENLECIKDMTVEEFFKRINNGLKLYTVKDNYAQLIYTTLYQTRYFKSNNLDYIFIEIPEKIKIGRFYKTRADKKAYVFDKTQANRFLYVVEGDSRIVSVGTDGRLCDNVDGKDDIVAEWQE